MSCRGRVPLAPGRQVCPTRVRRAPNDPPRTPLRSRITPICFFALRRAGVGERGGCAPFPALRPPSQVEPEAPPGTVPCMVPLMCRRVRVSAANPPPRPLQANLAVSRGLFTRSQMWLIRYECCSRWPGLWTAGCARPQAILGRETSRMRSRIVENQPLRCGKMGLQTLFCAFGGGAHRASAALSTPIRVRPAHPARGVHSRCQRRTTGPTWSPSMAARVVFVPELGSAGSPFPTFGPGRASVPPHVPVSHTPH